VAARSTKNGADVASTSLVQSRRKTRWAAKRFFRNCLKGWRYVRGVIVTDRCQLQRTPHREVLARSGTHRRSKYLNNRAETSHQADPGIRERVLKRFGLGAGGAGPHGSCLR